MSQYSTGLSSVTNNSPTVTGSNTLWLANVTAGDSFTVAGDGVMYDVASVDSDTQVTLSVPYAGTTASGVVYAIGTGFTVPDSFPEMSQGDIETATIFTRAMRKIQGKFSGIVSDISGKADISGQVFTGDIEAPKITASTGVLFGTDTAAANTLDDYEEGTWTPDLKFGTSVVYTTQLGTYTKIGNFVNVIFEIDVASRGDDISGIHIGSLPFIPEVGPFSNSDTKGPGSLDLRNTNFLDLTNGALLGNIGASNNTLRVYDINGASLSYTSCEASGIVTGAISYQST